MQCMLVLCESPHECVGVLCLKMKESMPHSMQGLMGECGNERYMYGRMHGVMGVFDAWSIDTLACLRVHMIPGGLALALYIYVVLGIQYAYVYERIGRWVE